MYEFHALLNAAEAACSSGCGLSDFLYEERVQAAYAGILASAPVELKDATEAALRARGFDPGFDPRRPGPGECSLTGIAVNCCPCGRHP